MNILMCWQSSVENDHLRSPRDEYIDVPARGRRRGVDDGTLMCAQSCRQYRCFHCEHWVKKYNPLQKKHSYGNLRWVF